MSLPNITAGDPHVAAHNAERAQINNLLAQVESLPDDNDPGLVKAFTSTTRPAAVEGRIIYETDTDRHVGVRNGVWVPISNLPMVQAHMTGVKVNNIQAAWQQLDLEGALVNNDNMWSAAAPDRLTVRTPGLYRIHGKVAFEPNGTGVRGINLRRVSGGDTVSLAEFFMTSFGLPGVFTTVALPPSIERFAVNDIVNFYGWQNSGGDLGYAEGEIWTHFGMQYVGP